MIAPEALDALRQYLDDEHGEQDCLSANSEAGLPLIKYSGSHDIVGDTNDAVIHALITLAPHKGKECWIAYMTGTVEGYSVAIVTHHASLGEHVDADAEVESILWIGEGEVPEEVEKALRTYHAQEVATDYASRLHVMNFALEDIAPYVPAQGRGAIATALTKLMRTNLL